MQFLTASVPASRARSLESVFYCFLVSGKLGTVKRSPTACAVAVALVKPGLPAETVEEGYRFGDNEVFLLSYRARTAQGEIDLTEMEVRVLALFFQKEGRPVHRTDLLQSVWGYSSDTETRTLDNFIVRLRKYFEPDPSHPKHFQTVRAVGYRFSRTGD